MTTNNEPAKPHETTHYVQKAITELKQFKPFLKDCW
jgi:hypothetical protein